MKDRTNIEREFESFRSAYEKRKPLYLAAISQAKRLIATIKQRHQRKATLRIAYIDARLKTEFSTIKKACDCGISADQVFDAIDDIVGVRIVVNNLKDIDSLISELEAEPRFSILEQRQHGDTDPYRATHLKAELSFSLDGKDRSIVCEVQIRTLLQDAWSVLTHRDVYKNQASMPSLGQVISQHMSESLACLDRLAEKFRSQIEREVRSPNDLSDDSPLDKQGIAFLYFDLFGKKPQEYEVDYLSKKAREYDVDVIGTARLGLKQTVFQKLDALHRGLFSTNAPDSDLMEFGILYSVHNVLALSKYKKRLQSDWEEIKRIARDEVLGELPDTFEEFVTMAESGEVPWEAFKELGGVGNCSRCETEIFTVDSSVEAILDHYDHPETDADLQGLLSDLGDGSYCPYEPESVNTPGLCAYCDYVMSKDD